MNFLFAMKLSNDFFCKIQISTNNEKILPKFNVLSIALARLGTILPVIRETTCIKTNFIIKFEMYKRSIVL